MSEQILVAYATSYGSTQEVADHVAATLRERGFQVELQVMRKVRSLTGYDAIVMGAPLYMFHWHKDALRFLSQHRKALRERPVALFALGPFTTGDDGEWHRSQEQLDGDLAKYPWLRPNAQVIFGGRFDPAKLRFPYSWIGPLKRLSATDLRDWEVIHRWAEQLPAALHIQHR